MTPTPGLAPALVSELRILGQSVSVTRGSSYRGGTLFRNPLRLPDHRRQDCGRKGHVDVKHGISGSSMYHRGWDLEAGLDRIGNDERCGRLHHERNLALLAFHG